MPHYHRLGSLPHKRHTQFRKPDGTLYHEEVMGLRGFSGIQSILYHHFRPTAVKSATLLTDAPLEYDRSDPSLTHHHLKTVAFPAKGDPISGREWLLGNAQVLMGLCAPVEAMPYFYRNGVCDELLFVHHGRGVFTSQFGTLPFRPGDYIVVPVGTTYQIRCDEPSRFLVIEAAGQVQPPKRYRNEYGQLLEHSPYCERDIVVPQTLEVHDQPGEHRVRVKMGDRLSEIVLDHHPCDVVGWDGYLYPWIFNIEDFEPITGRIHQPPPVHQTFAADGFVVCSYVPRMFDYHPEAIPVPYNHSNVNSDEVLYYVDGNFMSRRGIEIGSITLHPAGIPHGPHPGTLEASLGKQSTQELAVMLDTFAPLRLTAAAMKYVDPQYMTSWLG